MLGTSAATHKTHVDTMGKLLQVFGDVTITEVVEARNENIGRRVSTRNFIKGDAV